MKGTIFLKDSDNDNLQPAPTNHSNGSFDASEKAVEKNYVEEIPDIPEKTVEYDTTPEQPEFEEVVESEPKNDDILEEEIPDIDIAIEPPDVEVTETEESENENYQDTTAPELNKLSAQKLTKPVQEYIKTYKKALELENQEYSLTIHVDEIASKIAKLYEQVRQIIDWKEEHLVRRTAIQRIMKRRLISEISGIKLAELNTAEMAEHLIMELIRGGHFTNDRIPNEKIVNVNRTLDKYLYILKNDGIYKNFGAMNIKRKVQFYHWIVEIAASEIEEILDPAIKENALMELMTKLLMEGIKIIPENKISEDEKYLQTYIAVHRALFNLDAPLITFHILKRKFPNYMNFTEEEIKNFTLSIVSTWEEIENDLEYMYRAEFFEVAEKYDAPFLILGDVMKELEKSSPQALENSIAEESSLDILVSNAYGKRIKTLKKRLFRAAIFSTLSIFVAGGASLLIVEFPIAKLLYGKFGIWAIAVDIMLPTALMFFLVTLIRGPGKDNLKHLKTILRKFIYSASVPNIFEMYVEKKKNKILSFIFGLFYLIGGVLSMGFVFWLFKIANVPWTSLYIDVLNVAIVVFAAMVIKQRSKELTVKESGNFIEFVVNFFSVPMAKLGAWLASKWKEYNFISVFFTALIDMPFSTFIEGIEGWREFIKQKSSEIQ